MQDPEINGTQDTEKRVAKPIMRKKIVNQGIPDEILHNTALNEAIKRLPTNYSFEIHKTLWRIQTCNSKKVALQLPEGLLMYACTISDILEKFGKVETIIMGDVTYGACCIDDYTAKALGCDFMVHYGHSCLVPVDVSQMNTLYVFVDIGFNINHLISMLQTNFSSDSRLILAGTIQFSAALQAARKVMTAYFPNILIPQSRPLSQGEVLGCTSPHLPTLYPKDSCKNEKIDQSTEDEEGNIILDIGEKSKHAKDVCVFIADGRFHLESLMIHNPQIDEFYKYDPYNKMLTAESYDLDTLHTTRWSAIETAKKAKKWGVVLGTLGRQGSTVLMDRIEKELKLRNLEYMVILLSEVFPAKLELMSDIDAWVQVACPRLSIDWGYAFSAPLLSTYEFDVCLGLTEWLPNGVYPMDFYSNHGGAWSNYHHRQKANLKEVECDGGTEVIARPKHSAIAKIKARAAARRAEKAKLENSIKGEVVVIKNDVEAMD